MADQIYRDIDLAIPLTKAISFPDSVSVQTSSWNKIDLTLAEHRWLMAAVKAASEYPLINNEWLFGVEVEAEHVSMSDYNAKCTDCHYPIWTSKTDNSLRNNGMEFVSVPMKGSMLHKAVHFLTWALGPKVEFSPRCSVHIHLNVRDMTVAQVVSLGLVYAAVERILFRWIGQDRETNIFCVPLYATHDLQGLYAAAMVKFHKPVSFKYSALNFNTTCLHSGLPLYGTVEFRHLYGTLNVPILVRWLNLIFSIKRYAMKHALDKVLETTVQLNTTSAYGVFIKDVFGPFAAELLDGISDLADFQSLMEASISEVKRCSFANNFHRTMHEGYPGASSPFTKSLRKKFGPFTVKSTKKSSDVPKQSIPNEPLGHDASSEHNISVSEWMHGPDDQLDDLEEN